MNSEVVDSKKILRINKEIYYKEKLIKILEGRRDTELEEKTDVVDIKDLKLEIINLRRLMHNE